MLTDDLQVHFLELPKHNQNVHSPTDATPLEKWACFFGNASQLTPEEIGRLLQEQLRDCR